MGKEQELVQAIKNNDVESVKKVLAKFKSKSKKTTKKSGIHIVDIDGFTPLHHASLCGNGEIVMSLLEFTSDVNVKDKKGMTPLHLAAWAGKVEPALLLLDAGAVTNLCSRSGATPLHLASEHGNYVVVERLVDHECDPTVVNNRGETALDLACRFGHLEAVRILLNNSQGKCEKLLNPREFQEKFSPLHMAAKTGHFDVVKLLVEAGADVNQKGPSGTCLHEAALYGKLEVVKFLLETGIDVNVKNREGETALDIVTKFTKSGASSEIKHLLREASVEVVYAKAIRDYANISDQSFLTLRLGDIVLVLERRKDGMWKGCIRDEQKERIGYFPASAVKVLRSPSRNSVFLVVRSSTSSVEVPKVSTMATVSNSFEIVTLTPPNQPVAGKSRAPRMSSFRKKTSKSLSECLEPPRAEKKRNTMPIENGETRQDDTSPRPQSENDLDERKKRLNYLDIVLVDNKPNNHRSGFSRSQSVSTKPRTEYADVRLPTTNCTYADHTSTADTERTQDRRSSDYSQQRQQQETSQSVAPEKETCPPLPMKTRHYTMATTQSTSDLPPLPLKKSHSLSGRPPVHSTGEPALPPKLEKKNRSALRSDRRGTSPPPPPPPPPMSTTPSPAVTPQIAESNDLSVEQPPHPTPSPPPPPPPPPPSQQPSHLPSQPPPSPSQSPSNPPLQLPLQPSPPSSQEPSHPPSQPLPAPSQSPLQPPSPPSEPPLHSPLPSPPPSPPPPPSTVEHELTSPSSSSLDDFPPPPPTSMVEMPPKDVFPPNNEKVSPPAINPPHSDYALHDLRRREPCPLSTDVPGLYTERANMAPRSATVGKPRGEYEDMSRLFFPRSKSELPKSKKQTSDEKGYVIVKPVKALTPPPVTPPPVTAPSTRVASSPSLLYENFVPFKTALHDQQRSLSEPVVTTSSREMAESSLLTVIKPEKPGRHSYVNCSLSSGNAVLMDGENVVHTQETPVSPDEDEDSYVMDMSGEADSSPISIPLPIKPQGGVTNLRMRAFDELYDWLAQSKLLAYMDNFAGAGFDLTAIAGITADDLSKIEVTKTGHRKRLLSEAAKLPQPKLSEQNDVPSWLDALGFPQYENQFMDGGFDDIDFLCDLALEDLRAIGVTKVGHQRKILMATKRLEQRGTSKPPPLITKIEEQEAKESFSVVKELSQHPPGIEGSVGVNKDFPTAGQSASEYAVPRVSHYDEIKPGSSETPTDLSPDDVGWSQGLPNDQITNDCKGTEPQASVLPEDSLTEALETSEEDTINVTSRSHINTSAMNGTSVDVQDNVDGVKELASAFQQTIAQETEKAKRVPPPVKPKSFKKPPPAVAPKPKPGGHRGGAEKIEESPTDVNSKVDFTNVIKEAEALSEGSESPPSTLGREHKSDTSGSQGSLNSESEDFQREIKESLQHKKANVSSLEDINKQLAHTLSLSQEDLIEQQKRDEELKKYQSEQNNTDSLFTDIQGMLDNLNSELDDMFK